MEEGGAAGAVLRGWGWGWMEGGGWGWMEGGGWGWMEGGAGWRVGLDGGWGWGWIDCAERGAGQHGGKVIVTVYHFHHSTFITSMEWTSDR